jgi:pimeloyl-ACP methyl ester carboxylesterase
MARSRSQTESFTLENSTNGRSFPWFFGPLRFFFRVLGTVAPRAAGRLAVRLFRTPQRHRTPGRERRWLTSAEPFHVELDGRRLAAWSWGAGPTVLLVHGWEGRGSQLGAFAEPLVRSGFRVVAFDGPGHGATEGRLSSLPEFADAVTRMAEEVGPLHGVVAHSFGVAATGWAMDRGLEVERLVFVAPPYDLQDYIHLFSTVVGLPERARPRMIGRLESRFDIDWQRARHAPTIVAEEGKTTDTAAADTPLLVVHDRDDRESPIENGRAVAAVWPAGRLHETFGLGHRRVLRDPKVVETVAEFLDADALGAGASESAEPLRRVS